MQSELEQLREWILIESRLGQTQSSLNNVLLLSHVVTTTHCLWHCH